MSNVVKYGVGGKRMMNVPKKFLETEGRKKFQKVVSVVEKFVFIVTLTIVGIILLFMTSPNLLPESISELKVSLVIIPLFLTNLMGMFISSASDGTGVNWCARGIAVMFLFLGVGFILSSI